MNAHKICDHVLESQSILGKGKLIISGHFHLRDHRHYDNNKSILYLGSPYEMDFGERNQVKGIYFLNLENMELEFVENLISPKHFKIKVSELLSNQIDTKKIPSIINNNFIAIDVDKKLDTQTLDLIIGKFSQYQPKLVRTDFNIFEHLQ